MKRGQCRESLGRQPRQVGSLYWSDSPRRGVSAQRRQPPPEGAQVGVDRVPALLELKVENFCSICFEPQ